MVERIRYILKDKKEHITAEEIEQAMEDYKNGGFGE